HLVLKLLLLLRWWWRRHQRHRRLRRISAVERLHDGPNARLLRQRRRHLFKPPSFRLNLIAIVGLEEMALVEVRFYRLRTGFCSAWCSFLVFTSLAVFRIFIILVIASIVRAGPWRPSHAILLLQSATSVREPGGHLRDVGAHRPAVACRCCCGRGGSGGGGCCRRVRQIRGAANGAPLALANSPMVAARWRLKRSRSASLAYITAWVISTCIESNSPPVNEPYCRVMKPPDLGGGHAGAWHNPIAKAVQQAAEAPVADDELAGGQRTRGNRGRSGPTRPRMLVLAAGYWPLFSCDFLSLRCSDAQVANLSPVLRMMLPVNVEQESAAPAAPPHGINGLPHEAMSRTAVAISRVLGSPYSSALQLEPGQVAFHLQSPSAVSQPTARRSEIQSGLCLPPIISGRPKTPLHYSATGRATCHSVRQSSKSSKSMTTRQRQLLAGRVLRRQPLMLLLLLA
uniref:G_PROTEIN_RECEP_F1_2 domain-containing protein n=1 Tax=Macrostomum lignano TaxID=282301 RepID=A0A1I8IWZ1_9PLAT